MTRTIHVEAKRQAENIPEGSLFEMSIQVYENLYNQELQTRRDYDEKMVSRISILTVQLALAGILVEWFVDNLQTYSNEKMVCILSLVLLLLQMIYFYRSFFRVRKNYKEIALDEIRMYHLHCANEKTNIPRNLRYRILSDQEVELLTYLKDSYQYCAYYNMHTNLKRGAALIKFDNLTIINTLLLFANYFAIYMKGGLPWLQ